jgi:hypothetical protein
MSCPSNTKAATLTLGVVAFSCALSGCSDIYYDRRETVVPYAGDAKAINQVTMMVDPWPPYAANRNIAFNGERMQGAVERYRTRNVIRPVSPMTSDTQAQMQPPPNYTTEYVTTAGQASRNGPPPQPASSPAPWAGSSSSQSRATSQSQSQ